MSDSTIDTFPLTIIDVYKAMNKIKAGKAPGVCGIYPEYIQHGDSDALHSTHTAQNSHSGVGRGRGYRGMAPGHHNPSV